MYGGWLYRADRLCRAMRRHLKLGFSGASEPEWTTSLRAQTSPDILNSAAQKIRAGGDPGLVTDSAPEPNVKHGHSPLCCSRMVVLNKLVWNLDTARAASSRWSPPIVHETWVNLWGFLCYFRNVVLCSLWEVTIVGRATLKRYTYGSSRLC